MCILFLHHQYLKVTTFVLEVYLHRKLVFSEQQWENSDSWPGRSHPSTAADFAGILVSPIGVCGPQSSQSGQLTSWTTGHSTSLRSSLLVSLCPSCLPLTFCSFCLCSRDSLFSARLRLSSSSCCCLWAAVQIAISFLKRHQPHTQASTRARTHTHTRFKAGGELRDSGWHWRMRKQ